MGLRGGQQIQLLRVALCLYYTVSEKRDQHAFCNISYKTGAIVSWINLLQNDVNVYRFTRIMSLHYLVKLEMLIAPMLILSCYRKKLQNLSHLSCGLPNSPDLNPVDNSVWKILQEKVYKTRNHASLIWSYRRPCWRMAAAMTTRSSFNWSTPSQSLFLFVQISDACFVHLLLQ